MSKPTHKPNTQTTEDRALWQQIRQAIAQRTREKRLKYGLRSNREAHLHCPPPERQQTLHNGSKIIAFPATRSLAARRSGGTVTRTTHKTSANPPKTAAPVEVLVL